MQRITNPNQIPNFAHYAILIYKTRSIYHEGDERSRTNPGHGYPAYTETVNEIEHWTTTNESLLKAKVEALASERKSYPYKSPVFTVLKVEKKLNVETRTEVAIK